MKRIIVFIFGILFLSIYANAQQKEKYYAIDGSSWSSDRYRIWHELSLWKEKDTGISYMIKTQKFTKDMASRMADNIRTIKETLSSIRKLNSGLDILHDAESKEIWDKHKIKVESARASNNELFYLTELKDMYNLILKEYTFVEKFLLNATHQNLDETEVQLFFDEAEVKLSNTISISSTFQGKVLSKLAEMEMVLNLQDKSPEKVLSKSGVGTYYTLKGVKMQDTESRDENEKDMRADLETAFTKMHHSEKINDKEYSELKKLTTFLFTSLQDIRSSNERFAIVNKEIGRKNMQRTFPEADFDIYLASNNEVCYFIEIKDTYNGLVGIYDILHKIAAKGTDEDTDKSETTYELFAPRDYQGNTLDFLVKKVHTSLDGLNKKKKRITDKIEAEGKHV